MKNLILTSLNFLLNLLIISALLIVCSCSKARLDNTNQVTSTDYASANAFYAANAPQTQSFTIDSLGGDTIYGKEGTKIWNIPKTIYMLASNHNNIFYPYILDLVEAYSIKDMILSRLPNVAQGNLLVSGGEIEVTAFKNGSPLVLKQNCFIPIMMPSKPPVPGMQVYYGFTNGTTSDWNLDVTKTGYLFLKDTITNMQLNSYGYILKDVKLGWINCDQLFNITNKTNVTFTVPTGSTNPDNIDIYIVFKSLHSFMKVSVLTANNMPLGQNVTIFAIAMDSGGNNV